jgi:hypothetical protein
MPRKKRELDRPASRVIVALRVRPDQAERLKQCALDADLPMSRLIAHALDQVLEQRGYPRPARRAA